MNSGYRVSRLDHRDMRYGLVAPETITVSGLPASYDFATTATLPVFNQGRVPACVGYTLAGLKVAQEELEKGAVLPFDGLDIYSAIAAPGGGAEMRVGLDYLLKQGAAADGQRFPISSYAGVALQAHDEVKHALVTSRVLVAGFEVPRSFMQGGGHEFVVAEGEDDQIVGGHAILVVGYDETGLILHNSWGEQWGNAGRTTITWEFWDRHFMEAWACVDTTDPVVAAKIEAVTSPLGPPSST